MTEDLMRYDQLAQSALRGVVREALRRVHRQGLPGEHHFYIAFNTKYPGVVISPRVAERYPREMTVVLQHQFWNLQIHDDRFEVELSFDNIPEKLVVPFNSIKGFLDPAVQFGLQFEVVQVEEEATDTVQPNSAAKPAGDGPDETQSPASNSETPNVVSLDAFRKK
ncbi:MAG: ClpXP protease specificity-enhancing factor SspB [Proteobacteria bacterium]|nr:ClpXP protease specificity-enhancing factor SspB [Pseudomonadota bacterium]